MSVQSEINIRPDGTASVPSVEILEEVYSSSLPKGSSTFTQILEELHQYTRDQFSQKSSSLKLPTGNAFSNCNGRWSEYICAAYAWNALAAINSAPNAPFIYIYTKLPNNSSSRNRWVNLLKSVFVEKINELTRDKEDPQVIASGHTAWTLFSSNPDAVILKYPVAQLGGLHLSCDPRTPITNLTKSVLDNFDSIYNRLKGTVNPHDNLQCFLSVKTSTRPDRRYQFVHEGDNIKSLLIFLVNSRVDTNFTIHDIQRKYFAFSLNKVSIPDTQAMETGSSACIVTPSLPPIWPVDKLYECLTPDAVAAMIRDILT